MNKKKTSYDRIYEIVRQIPKGKVATYGQVAEIAGMKGSARLVGYALHSIPEGSDIPWQRVINSKGMISSYGEMEWVEFHRSLLQSEGVEFNEKQQIDLAVFQWQKKI